MRSSKNYKLAGLLFSVAGCLQVILGNSPVGVVHFIAAVMFLRVGDKWQAIEEERR